MNYKTFISHRSKDYKIAYNMYQLLNFYGIHGYLAEHELCPNRFLSDKVINNLKNSDSVIALLTRDGINSKYVQNEIGIAIGSDFPLIPIVEKGIRQEELAVLQGREYIEYDPYYSQQSLFKAASYVNSLKLRKEQGIKAVLALGIFAGIAYMASSKS